MVSGRSGSSRHVGYASRRSALINPVTSETADVPPFLLVQIIFSCTIQFSVYKLIFLVQINFFLYKLFCIVTLAAQEPTMHLGT